MLLVAGACGDDDRGDAADPPAPTRSADESASIADAADPDVDPPPEVDAAEPAPPARPTDFDGDPVLLAAVDDVEAALRRHPDAAWRVGEARLAAELDGLRGRVDELTLDQLQLEVVRIAAQLDGHTVARPTEPWPVAAISFYRFDDGLHVTRAEDPALVGARLVAVGATPVDVAWDAIVPHVSWDSEQTIWLAGPSLLRTPRVLATLGVVEDPTTVTYTLVRTDGTTVTHTPRIVGQDAPAEVADLVTVGLPAVAGVRWLELRDVPFWSEHQPAHDVVYLQFNRVRGSAVSPLTGENVIPSDEVDRVEELLAAHPTARLVVDVRHNPGGDNTTLRQFRAMVDEVAGDDPCRVAMIIGRQTFSAAANFATMVEQDTPARFYGEPTGGSPNLYGDTRQYPVEALGMRLFVSSRYWRMSTPDDTREAIAPDVPAPLRVGDFLAGRDPVMAAVVGDPVCAN